MAFSTACIDAGYATLRDVPEVEIDQCTTGVFTLILRTPNGAAIDLTAYGIYNASSSSGLFTGVRVVVKEMPADHVPWATVDADVTNAAGGVVEVAYAATKLTKRCGIFTAEAQIWEDGVMRKIYPFFLIVNPSLSAAPSHDMQALSVIEIRMTLRDVDPVSNFLIDELDFKTNEIALMIRRCVDYWNEVPPPVAVYKATTFPFRYPLSIGVVGELHQMAAVQKMRNNLDYSAGGVTVADTIKWQQYSNLADKYAAQWKQWVKDTKYRMNIEGGFRSLNSGYSRSSFWSSYR